MKLYGLFHRQYVEYEFDDLNLVYISEDKNKVEEFKMEYSKKFNKVKYVNHIFFIEEIETDKELKLND